MKQFTPGFPEIWTAEWQPTLNECRIQKLYELEEEIKELKQQNKELNDKNFREFLKEHLSIQCEYDSWDRIIEIKLCLDDEKFSTESICIR